MLQNPKDRSFKGFSKLVKLLEINHNITVNDPVEAQRILMHHSYYALVNGYQSALGQPGNSEKFLNGTTIEQLEALHVVESLLASSYLRGIVDVEQTLRVALQYVVSKHFGHTQIDYLEKHNYSSTPDADRIATTKKFKKIVTGINPNGTINTGENVSDALLYHRNNGNVPPWVLVNDLTLGQLLLWLKILKKPQKKEILYLIIPNITIPETSSTSSFDETWQFFVTSLEILRNYRNSFAHGDVVNKIRPTDSLLWKQIAHAYPNNSFVSESEYNVQSIGKQDLLALTAILGMFIPEKHKQLLSLDLLHFIDVIGQAFENINNTSIRNVFNIPDNFDKRIKEILK